MNKRFPIGVDTVLNKADSKLLKSYYDLWYRPDNMALVVVGDFNAKLVESMIVKRFSKLQPRTKFSKSTLQTKFKDHKDIEVFYHYEPEASSTEVTIETVCWKPFEQLTIDNIHRELNLKKTNVWFIRNLHPR